MWTHYLQTCIYPYYNFASSALDWLCLCQLTFNRLQKFLREVEAKPHKDRTRSFKKYYG